MSFFWEPSRAYGVAQLEKTYRKGPACRVSSDESGDAQLS